MNAFLLFTVKVSVIMVIFYIPYNLIFSKTTFFRLNRMYLIGSMFVSLIIPLFNIPLSQDKGVIILQKMLEPVTIYANGPNKVFSASLSELPILNIIYISGTFIFTFFLLYRIYQLLRLIRRHGINRRNGINLVTVNKGFAPSSFFTYIFLSANENHDEILAHEQVHIRQGHSFDIMFIEIIILICWFNPFVWIYRSSIRNIHEYLADEETLQKGYDRVNYQHLVFENTFGIRLNELTTNFNYSPLKTRLKMIIKNKSDNSKKWLYLITIPVMAMVFVYFGCKQSLAQDNEEKKISLKDTEKANTEEVKEEVFVIVDEMPSFQGGDQNNFRDYINKNLVYPDEAKKNRIQGKVFVQFVVSTKGKVVDATVVRSVDPFLDKEALRVINASPAWTPGKNEGNPVSVRFTFPINFVLK